MNSNKCKTILLIISICLLNCKPGSEIKTYKFRSFFFDGVPNPNIKIQRDSLKMVRIKDSINRINRITELSKQDEEIEGSIHTPFKDRNCFVCHDEQNRSQPKTKLLDLCFTCHDGYKKTFMISHGPAGSGHCTNCHNAHLSPNKKLIKIVGPELCYQCHVKKDINDNNYHSNILDKTCLECHNPHGGKDKNLLRDDACTKCHINIKEGNTEMHGPVEINNCELCHNSQNDFRHYSLSLTGVNLCFECHVPKEINKSDWHINNQGQNCTICHDPHGANNKYLLKGI